MENEQQIIKRAFKPAMVQQVISQQEILQAQQLVNQVYVDQQLLDYITRLVFATRNPLLAGADKLAGCAITLVAVPNIGL